MASQSGARRRQQYSTTEYANGVELRGHPVELRGRPGAAQPVEHGCGLYLALAFGTADLVVGGRFDGGGFGNEAALRVKAWAQATHGLRGSGPFG